MYVTINVTVILDATVVTQLTRYYKLETNNSQH